MEGYPDLHLTVGKVSPDLMLEGKQGCQKAPNWWLACLDFRPPFHYYYCINIILTLLLITDLSGAGISSIIWVAWSNSLLLVVCTELDYQCGLLHHPYSSLVSTSWFTGWSVIYCRLLSYLCQAYYAHPSHIFLSIAYNLKPIWTPFYNF